jgi:hypothetical protein
LVATDSNPLTEPAPCRPPDARALSPAKADVESEQPQTKPGSGKPEGFLNSENAWKLGVTGAIVSSEFLIATLVRRVSVIYMIRGSFILLLVCYVIPGACYYRLTRDADEPHKYRPALAFTIVSAAVNVICVIATLYGLSRGH